MSRPALRRAAGVCAVLIGLSLALGYLRIGGTFAFLTSQTENAGSAFAAGWISPPTGLGTPTVAGGAASLSWTPGTTQVTGQALYGADGGTGATSSCGTYASLATMASAATSTYSDSRGSSFYGHWYCYEMVSTHSGWSWTAAAAFTPVRLGFVATGIALANGNGTLGNNDTITVTFDQQPATPTSPMVVCAFSGSPGTIVLGDTHAGGCGTTSDASSLGTITGTSISGTGFVSFGTSTVSRSGSTYVITLKGGSNLTSGTGTKTYTPASTMKSSSANGSIAVCTTGAACLPTTTGNF